MRYDFLKTVNRQLSSGVCFRRARKRVVPLAYFVRIASVSGPVFSQMPSSARTEISGEVSYGGAVLGEVASEKNVDFRQTRRTGDFLNVVIENRAESRRRSSESVSSLNREGAKSADERGQQDKNPVWGFLEEIGEKIEHALLGFLLGFGIPMLSATNVRKPNE